jgi:ribosomal protein S18 acetylase RimI-like enzyme
LLVETSSLAEQDGARAFYRRQGFVEEARIRDFYADREDKVVSCRRLAT